MSTRDRLKEKAQGLVREMMEKSLSRREAIISAALRAERIAALEEAAKVAERWEHSPAHEVAGQIRSLAEVERGGGE